MPWTIKSKIPQSGEDEPILTPDGYNILVGEAEDQILLYQNAFENWSNKVKNAIGSWNLKTKIEA
jgi:hypothetical protein